MATATIEKPKNESTPQPSPEPIKKKPLWLKALFVLAALFAVLCAIIAIQPEDFRVSRSATIAAPPADVFELVNNLQKWNDWSPWAKLDPNAKNTFEGPTSGTGAKFHWDGDSNVGAGTMTIVDSKPNEHVKMNLAFIRPFEGTNDVAFTLKPEGDGTHVTWSMEGKNNFIGKAIGLVMDCEKMCGDQFEQGFANMKQVVEKPSSN
jgi:uncharacterized protein YndB with AHSA1/START domain